MTIRDQDNSLKPGARNLITDVPGLKVANRSDARLKSGVTVLLPDRPVTAAYDIRGGGVGSRELGALSPGGTVESIHGLVLSGGSAFGLDAATGVQSYLHEKSIGFEIGDVNVPIVPQAILFDLLNGGDKDWGTFPPYRNMAYAACSDVADTFELGSTGAGTGATTFSLKGGLGSASLLLEDGLIVGALAAVNAMGSSIIGQTRHFWAAPLEIDGEFGGHGLPEPFPENPVPKLGLSNPGENTTLCVVATNAALDRKALTRLAIMAQTGMARALMPVHSPLDGDIVFALSTGDLPLSDPLTDLNRLGTHAANTLTRAIARAVYFAEPDPHDTDLKPTYSEMFSSAAR